MLDGTQQETGMYVYSTSVSEDTGDGVQDRERASDPVMRLVLSPEAVVMHWHTLAYSLCIL